jgi:hypothetical protein
MGGLGDQFPNEEKVRSWQIHTGVHKRVIAGVVKEDRST